MSGKELKNSILQMAVQGKLIPQNPDDEPASVLIERIRTEKEQLIKEGEIKKEKNPSRIFRGADNLFYEQIGKNEPICIADEVPFEIPESWEWVRLSSITKMITKGTTPRGGNVSYLESGIGFLRAENVGGLDILDKGNLKYIDEDVHNGFLKRSILEVNDILITIAGTLGRTAIVRQNDLPLNTNQAVAIVRPINSHYIDLIYIIYALNSPLIQNTLTLQEKITAIPNLTLEIISDCIVPLPPLAEQRRIVEKIEELMPKAMEYEKLETDLSALQESFPEALKKAVLKEAVQGKLLPQDPNDEPAKELLKKIRAEKEALIKAGKIKRDKNESEIIKKAGAYYEKRGDTLTPIDDEIPFPIPDSWEWVRLGSICTKLVDGDHNPPKGEAMITPFIMASSTNINNNTLVELDKVRYLSADVFKIENERTQATEGDIFFTSVGSLGRSCVFQGKLNICFQRSVSVLTTLAYNYYLKYCLDSSFVQQKVTSESTGTAQRGFYLNQLSKLLVPLPPLAEQRRIVEKIESAFSAIASL